MIQITFPELESFLSTPAGEQYWNLVSLFPTKDFVIELSEAQLAVAIRHSTSKRISDKRVAHLTDKLPQLAERSYSAVKKILRSSRKSDIMLMNLGVYLNVDKRRQAVLNSKVQLAKPLTEYNILLSIPGIAEATATSIIGELGDVRRFHSANQINAFIGIDLRHYESGNFLAEEHITKRGNPYVQKILFRCVHNIISASHTNPCHIADFYQERKRRSAIYDRLYASSYQDNVLPHHA